MEFAPSCRLEALPPYLFAALRRKMAELREAGRDPITLGIGDPDFPAPDPVVDELIRGLTDPDDADRHRYGCDRPWEGLPAAFAEFYGRWFGVAVEPGGVTVGMGSKDEIVRLCLGLLNPGDLAIAHEPGYPTYNVGHVFAGAVTYYAPLRADLGWRLDFAEIPASVARRAKLLWISYPQNPTTATADVAYYAEAVEFCRRYGLLLCSDLAYATNTYDGYRAPSVLEVPGAEEVAVEFLSLSKAFCLTGWRVGCVVGNASAQAALRKVKDSSDNGQLRPVQRAAAWALAHAEELAPRVNAVYQPRRDRVVAALRERGFELESPRAGLYLWVKVPAGFGGDSIRFAEHLLDRAAVAVTPGVGFGESGEGYFRLSLTYPDAVIEEALRRIVASL